MGDGTGRALELLELLQSAHLRTVAELAEHLGVDERTVRRDVARLVALGLPVESLRGRHGGYRLTPGRRVLPLTFTSEEVTAVFLGLSGEQPASHGRGVAAQTALAKMKRALPASDAQRIDALLAAVPRGRRPRDADPDPAVVLTLADAVDRRRVVDVRYRDRAGTASRRTLHPDGLVARGGRWYLLALDADTQEERVFRVDRVETARPLARTFAPSDRADAEARLLDHLAGAAYRWRVVLRVRQTQEHVRAHLPPSVARLERVEQAERLGRTDAPAEDDDPLPWHRVRIHAEDLAWLPSVIAALDCEVVVEQPDELRERVRAAAGRLLRAASGEPAGDV